MALSEAPVEQESLNNSGAIQGTTAATDINEHSNSVSNSVRDTNVDVKQEVPPSKLEHWQLKEFSQPAFQSQNGGIKQNESLQIPRSTASCYSALSSHLAESQKLTKLLPSSLLHHCSICCPFHEPECCSGSQQEGSPLQGSLHSRALHMNSCCIKGTSSLCMQNFWQEHFQNQPNTSTLSSARTFRFPRSYAELIADWPVVVLGVCTILIVVCTLVGVLVPDLPDFSDPLLGFEPRGTTIGQRLVTWNNMVKNTGYKATLANYPYKLADELAKGHQEERWSEDQGDDREKRQAEWDFSKDNFFCDVPGERYPRIVFASAEGKNLWNVHGIKSMCNFDSSQVRSHPQYRSLCQRTSMDSCCPSWTLGNYIAVLNNKSSCQKITEGDVSRTLKILRICAKYYYNGTLGPECWDTTSRRKDQVKCANIPRKCTKYNAVYQILHFLVDKDFLSPKSNNINPPVLKYSMLFSPTEKGKTMMNIYLDNFENWNSSDGITTVTGIEFGIKHHLFQDYLLTDIVYPAIAIVIVLLVMCVYTKSVFITIMTMFTIISSLIISYVLYRVVFNFEFFPFMNLTALIILVGIGADDAFVLCDVWNYTKIDKPNSGLSEIVNVTLHHAALSMFVTSFTTSAAFYANYVSNITAIRCFGVYAGTAILVNYFLMVTWLPAVVVLHERYLLNLFVCTRSPSHYRSCSASFMMNLSRKASNCLLGFSGTARFVFEKVLPGVVIKLRYLWLLWFLVLTAGGAYIVCVSPKMKLPSLELSEFQVFRSTHPFELYDAEYKKLFMFERVHHGEDLHMPITIIWGVLPVDNGDPLSPQNKGNLTLDTRFNIASPGSQTWILNFCQKLRNQSFVFQSDEQDFTSCFMETFKQWMENQDCDEAKVYPCCSQSTFPYKQDVFETCIKKAIMELEHSAFYYLDSKSPGPRFDINDTICAIVLEFQSTFHFTLAYEKIHIFYNEVDSWIQEELKNAPDGLAYGWFVSNLEFYDLQDSLSTGTLIAMALSVLVALGVMLLTTWNIVISFFAIVSIAGTIFVTVGSLVLLGWELNVLESVTISVAVGLSVDFAVHYGIAYRLAPEPDREGKVVFSLSRMGSAIAMAAVTTFVAGAMMMPSTVLAYTQLGTFLMLIMCISWVFATFFFQSLCCCIGPQGTCGQIPMPKILKSFAFDAGNSGSASGHCKVKHCQSSKYLSNMRESEVVYELEPLASHSRNVDQTDGREVCTQLTYRSAFERENSGLGNIIPSSNLACLQRYNKNCSCNDVLQQPIKATQWTRQQPHLQCVCPCPTLEMASSGNNGANFQDTLSTFDTIHMTTKHDINQQHCPPVHFHPCSEGCYLIGYSKHTLHLQSLAHPTDGLGADESQLNSTVNSTSPHDEIDCPASTHNIPCCTVSTTHRDSNTNENSETSRDETNHQLLPYTLHNHVKTKITNGSSVQCSHEKFNMEPTMSDKRFMCKQYNREINEGKESPPPQKKVSALRVL